MVAKYLLVGETKIEFDRYNETYTPGRSSSASFSIDDDSYNEVLNLLGSFTGTSFFVLDETGDKEILVYENASIKSISRSGGAGSPTRTVIEIYPIEGEILHSRKL